MSVNQVAPRSKEGGRSFDVKGAALLTGAIAVLALSGTLVVDAMSGQNLMHAANLPFDKTAEDMAGFVAGVGSGYLTLRTITHRHLRDASLAK